MSVANKYIEGLKKAYIKIDEEEKWNEFEAVREGVSDKDLNSLKEIYPDIPQSLIEILKFVDGTYYRMYGENEVDFYFLGSDIKGYPYYLLSATQMILNKDLAYNSYGKFVSREHEEYLGIVEDEKISSDINNMLWLHFSDCMNDGESSQLFIDFTPSKKGIKGQIVRYKDDLDKISVIANSFDEYLQMLMENNYAFIKKGIV